jgi:hypothetical protein
MGRGRRKRADATGRRPRQEDSAQGGPRPTDGPESGNRGVVAFNVAGPAEHQPPNLYPIRSGRIG